MLLEAFRERNIPAFDPVLQENLLAKIHAKMQPAETPVRKMGWWRVAAAVGGVMVLLGGGALLLRQPQKQAVDLAAVTEGLKTETLRDIAPGGNKARLVLANGNTVVLDQAADGRIGEGNVEKKDAELLYGSEDHGSRGNNILITPRGGQYRVRLADGTKVWLNAASKLEYPAIFEGNERLVSLTGEAYFEVATDVQRPFLL